MAVITVLERMDFERVELTDQTPSLSSFRAEKNGFYYEFEYTHKTGVLRYRETGSKYWRTFWKAGS
ncbi:hypothetical protein BpsS36_00061 [Bacillus phage vB_BpsS-36]|uniref:Uncharacterized protein n=1 Tax=Bacillus phage vB_BpsS-36 TaxID=2419622 RepID=A0A3G3BX76_9CAUD|nr:hypothetical protein BpsS36_00061 [Bacillus phage vB_BpsS-36]